VAGLRPAPAGALAHGGYAGGVRFAAGYPGTAGTAFLKTGARHDGIDPEWATNEREGD
jgi:TPP-dependent indolepyruvate ferredoxin oxidoreductase alpha subunit